MALPLDTQEEASDHHGHVLDLVPGYLPEHRGNGHGLDGHPAITPPACEYLFPTTSLSHRHQTGIDLHLSLSCKRLF